MCMSDDRYWGAGIHWSIKPDMSSRQRERLIHRKYVLKEWVSTSRSWELDMQKEHPLDKDELAVMDYITARKRVKTTSPKSETRIPTTTKMETKPSKKVTRVPPQTRERRHYREYPIVEREKRSTSTDTRWSDEIVSDGRSVMVTKVAVEGNRAPRLSELVINDGRNRMRERSTKLKENARAPEVTPKSVHRHSQGAMGNVVNSNRNIVSNT